jgi:hypothetical protein
MFDNFKRRRAAMIKGTKSTSSKMNCLFCNFGVGWMDETETDWNS